MSLRKPFYSRDPRSRDRRDRENRDRSHGIGTRDRDREDYRRRKRSLSRGRSDVDKRRSRSPRKSDKDIDENILREISKLPDPSELWDNQFSQEPSNFPPPLNSAFNPDPNFQSSSFPPPETSYPGLYDEFPSIAPIPTTQRAEWNQLTLPPAAVPTRPTPAFVPNIEDQIKKEAAIESEMRQQKAALSKQREDYIKKSNILKKELDTLKDQRNELRGDAKRSPSPDTKRFLKENTKLQLEIQNKLKTIDNVVDMLNGIIGEEAQSLPANSEETSERSSKRKSRSPSGGQKFNYVYYDPEMHWCRVCNEFPSTAKDYLNHLHSAAHHKMAAAHMEAPWHSVSGLNEGFPPHPAAPTKRTPIRGLQFFVPSTAWYCKLCDQFIGDLHCASAHLKSIVHSKNYSNFVEQNPHWETDWMSDRQRAVEKSRGKSKAPPAPPPPGGYAAHTITFHKDGFHTKNAKDSPPPAEEKKKESRKKKSKKSKRSSSTSSSQSSSSSSDGAKKKKKKEKVKIKKEKEDPAITEWMSSNRLTDDDRKLIDSIKYRMKHAVKEEKTSETPEKDRDREREKNTTSVEKKSNEHEPRRREPPRRQDERRHDDRRHDERRNDERRHDNDTARGHARVKDDSPAGQDKKPEPKKMPFIGKMPVFKSLVKTKVEEQKKEEEQKKKEEIEALEAAKKRRVEIDAEIQKKVAEFKQKIAKAQMAQDQPRPILPTGLPLPTPDFPPMLGPSTGAPPGAPPVPPLPQDFQEALDIIFPDAKKAEQDLFAGMAGLPGFPGLPIPGMPGFSHLLPQMAQMGQMPQMPQMPQMAQMPQFMGFDMNHQLFPRPQLYDNHVPMKPRQQNNNRPKQQNQRQQNQNQNKNNQGRNQNNQGRNQNNQGRNQNNQQQNQNNQQQNDKKKSQNTNVEKKQEKMDDLALLGIDASDVGAGM